MPDDSPLVAAGRAHHRLGALAEAKAHYHAALAQDPRDGEALHLLGVLAQQEGDLAQCVKLIEAGLSIRPTAPAYSNLSHALWRLGRHGEAQAAAEAALALDPQSLEARQNLGNALHALGRSNEAAAIFQQALSLSPGHLQISTNLGIVLVELGRGAEALAVFDDILSRDPVNAQAQFNRGNALFRLEDWEGAAEAYRRALTLNPALAPAAHNLGAALRSQGLNQAAVDAYRSAAVLDPNRADTQLLLGALLVDLRAFAAAIPPCRRALALRPGDADARLALGAALTGAQQSQEAVEVLGALATERPDQMAPLSHLANAYRDLGDLAAVAEIHRRAAKIDPHPAQSLTSLGGVLKELGQFQGAVEACIRAIRHDPDHAAAYINLGAAKMEQGRLAESIAALEQAIALQPQNGMAHCNRAVGLYRQGRLGEAIAAFEEGLAWSDTPNARWNYSHALLKAGRFAEGWRALDQRLHVPGPVRSTYDYPQPLWTGDRFEGQTLLLHGEQGLGDAIQCLRYAPLAAERGGRLIVQVRPPLAALVARLPGVDGVVSEGEPLAFDLHCPLFSLPGIFEADFATIPGAPYLAADPLRQAIWAERLPPGPFRIGVVWQGNPAASVERGRSIPLSAFAPLMMDGVELVSLQKEHGLDQLEALPEGMAVTLLGDDYEIGDLDETAAVMMALDLVVCCDTSVAHLAGALGRPVWLAVNAVGDWRWLEERADSPWYPTMRLFRQPRPGDWAGAMAQIAAALQRRLAERAARLPA
jgi:tetratricopeptide (TPR) repeat protein